MPGPYPNNQGNPAGAIPVYVVSSGGTSGTPRALAANTIVVGGTPVTVDSGPSGGGFVTNPIASTSQGIDTAETLYISQVVGSPPGSTDAAAFGTTFALVPGQTFSWQTLIAGSGVQVNAATSGHRFSGNRF